MTVWQRHASDMPFRARRPVIFMSFIKNVTQIRVARLPALVGWLSWSICQI
jgi:hypothetical protein